MGGPTSWTGRPGMHLTRALGLVGSDGAAMARRHWRLRDKC